MRNTMTDTVTSNLSSPAVVETMELLRPRVDSQLRLKDGYIDFVGESDDPTGTKLGQRFFRSRMIPPIYERLWRPSVARSGFGWRGPRAEEECRITLEMLDASPGGRVLDVGCGPGNYTRHFARAAVDGLAVGLDASAAMLAAAARRPDNGSNVAYVRGDGASLPFEDATFDAVGCVGALHLIPEPMEALEGMVRVLAPGGRLVLVATCAPGPDRGRERAGIHAFGRDELTGALLEYGLVDIEQRVVKRGQFVAARKPGE